MDLGLHLVLNSEWSAYRWGPLSPRDAVPSLLDGDGYLPLLETTIGERARPAEVEREIRAQVDRAKASGIRVSHLDSHMAALFQSAGLLEVYMRVGSDYGVPVLLERTGTRGGERAPWAAASAGPSWTGRPTAPVCPAGVAGRVPAILTLPPGVYRSSCTGTERAVPPDHLTGRRLRQADFDLVKSQAFRWRLLRDQRFVLVGRKRPGAGEEPGRLALLTTARPRE
jgi:hypothetical protein